MAPKKQSLGSMAPKKFKSRQAEDKAFKTYAAADGEAIRVYQDMPKSLKAQFKATWVATGTFEHVGQYKTRTIQNVQRDGDISIPKSEAWLIRELGEEGAKRHIAWARQLKQSLFVFMLLSRCCRACEVQTFNSCCSGFV